MPVSEVVSSSFCLRKIYLQIAYLSEVFNMKSPLGNIKCHVGKHINKNNFLKEWAFSILRKILLHSKLIIMIYVDDAGD